MADDADIAEQNIEIQLESKIRDARVQSLIKPDIEDGHSYCLFCGADLGEVKDGEPVRRWCDRDCCSRWEKENPNR